MGYTLDKMMDVNIVAYGEDTWTHTRLRVFKRQSGKEEVKKVFLKE